MLRRTLVLLTLVLASPLACAVQPAEQAGTRLGEPPVVEVRKIGDHWVLLRDKEPYFVKGAGGSGNLKMLAKSGGNSIRTWGEGQLEPREMEDGSFRSILDYCHELGLTVCAGFWAEHPEHGFDYSDPEFIEMQREKARAFVRKWKHHPAILMWGVSNEVALVADPYTVFGEMNELAKIFKEEDPNRPTTVVIAGPWNNKVVAYAELCPDVDILGVNVYGGAPAVSQSLLTQGYDGPYMLTEYGARGHWETAITHWGAPIEQTSSEKAEHYRMSHDAGIADQPDRALGGYVFLWGQKQERTETWYGMFTKTGLAMEPVDVMTDIWGGTRDNRCPAEIEFDFPAMSTSVRPGDTLTASATAVDPEGDELTYRWVLKEESTDREKIGGAREKEPPVVATGFAISGDRVTFPAPTEPGAYRLFIFLDDGNGNTATANGPFRVLDEGR